ncbi:MAG TPA: hypothetical protein VJN01_08500 [Xanthomonadales bacterium]|nr:hypothetical protein [Xanthomonadales bacterium]
MKTSIRVSMLVLAATAGFSVNASAQTPTCADVVWSAALLEATPNIANHCLEMVQRDGEWYAKVQAKIVRHGANSTVVRYREPDGSWSSAERAYPPRGFKAEIGGQEIAISQTVPGQEMNVYAGSQGGENFTIPMLAGAAAAEAVAEEAVEEEMVEEAPVEEEAPAALPTTAGQSGWLAILGSMLLLLAGVAHVVRSRS